VKKTVEEQVKKAVVDEEDPFSQYGHQQIHITHKYTWSRLRGHL
jgi:hypothetical protein